MLKEIKKIRQDKDRKKRRWFRDDFFDLFIWSGTDREILGFQLCYDIMGEEKVFSWQEEKGFSHDKVDTGEDTPLVNMTPIIVPDGMFPFDYVNNLFRKNSAKIDRNISRFIMKKMEEYSGKH